MRHAFFLLSALLVVPPALGPGGSQAPALFDDAAPPAGPGVPSDPAIFRARFVTVRFALLAGPPGSAPGAAETLDLNPFPGVALTAVRDDVVPTSSGQGFVWLGHVLGPEPNRVALVVEDGVMAGNVRAGSAFYQVRYAGEGVHLVYEIDPRAFGPD
jgi:hypothetical protein